MDEFKIKSCPFCGGTKLKVERKSRLAGWNGLDMRVDAQTAADVAPVVRCKDCKYYRYDIKDEFSSCYLGSLSGPDGNDFCCYGERKE